MSRIAVLTPLDLMGLVLIVTAWLAIGWRIEHPGRERVSVTVTMVKYRKQWMREMITREPRIFDAQILGGLRQGTAFFASTCLLALGGVLALVGNSEQLLMVARDLSLAEHPTLIWQIKLSVVALFLVNAFLKFAWANRVFGYCAVVMAAVPNDAGDPVALARADKAAELNIRAAWNFNRGLRSVYFALGAVAWLLGPVPLMIATAVTVWTLWEREFISVTHRILNRPEDNA
ncbi:MAG: DUF599 domain-containing protein [Pseudomonadota bacterium]